MLLGYFVSDFKMSVAAVITGITFCFSCDICCISIVRSLYFKIFLVS
jgi:hypothetical protein